MTADTLTRIQELHSRFNQGTQVRLLWNREDNRVWVSVLHTRSGQIFTVDVEKDERPLDVFNHPFAYAAYHGIDTDAPRRRLTPIETSA